MRSKPKTEHSAAPAQEMRAQEPGSPTSAGVARGGVEGPAAQTPASATTSDRPPEAAPGQGPHVQAALPAEAAQPAAKPAEKNFSVRIKAKEDSWLFITADGKFVMQDILTADRQKVIKADKQIVLKTGNAGGIDVLFNGRSLGALGNENEPRTLTFNATGLVQ